MSDRKRSGWKQKKPPCPRCGDANPVPILYGLPTSDAGRAAERGEIALGGCCFDEDNPIWHCNSCGNRWGRMGDTKEWRF